MLEEAWTISPRVALRPEPFGALAYHFGNRRLTFLKRPELVELVTALRAHPTVKSALVASGISAGRYPGYLEALARLADADLIRRRAPEEETP